jgi:hypothetical protein
MRLSDEVIDVLRNLSEGLEVRHRPAFFKECAAEIEASRDAVGPGTAFRLGREIQTRHRDPGAATGPVNGDRSRWR